MAHSPLAEPKGIFATVELAIKQRAFGCRACGQCLLSQCAYICPMQCPKGLRNGPCGGMVNGACEVNPQSPCIWNNIHAELDDSRWHQSLRQPVNEGLFGTSSWLNFVTGSDCDGRMPSALPSDRISVPVRGTRPLLAGKKFAITAELRTPRFDSPIQLRRRIKDAAVLKEAVDAACVTSHPGCMSPEVFCQHVHRETGIETIVPLVGRDCKPGEIGRPLATRLNDAGAAAVLCLSGDYTGVAPFPMDSAQVLFALRDMKWAGMRPLFGAALHIQAQPRKAALARAAQKALAGAEIFFSQMLLGEDGVTEFISEMRTMPELRDRPLMLGIPLIGSSSGFNALERLPGVDRSSQFLQRFRSCDNILSDGLNAATQLAEFALSLRPQGVAGIHVMPFGVSASDTAGWIRNLGIAGETAAKLEQGSMRYV